MQYTELDKDDLISTIKRNNKELGELYLTQNKFLTMIEERDLIIEKCITTIQNLQAQILEDSELLPQRNEIKEAIFNCKEIPMG